MARGPKPVLRVSLSSKELRQLKHLSRQSTAPFARVLRARIVVAAHEHPLWSNAEIARRVGCSTRTVRKWRRRWRLSHALHDAARSGCPRFFSGNAARATHGSGVHVAAHAAAALVAVVGGGVGAGGAAAGGCEKDFAGDGAAVVGRGADQAVAISLVATVQ